jgi:hypothetical protein
MYVYTIQSSWNPKYDTLDPDELQRDRYIACVITQQYSSAAFLRLSFYFRYEKFGAFKKMLLFDFLVRKSEISEVGERLSRGITLINLLKIKVYCMYHQV